MPPPAKRVLLVTNNATLRTTLDRSLTWLGYIAEHASNVPMGLARLRPDIDLVLLDIHLSEMDGFEAVRRIREHRMATDMPIIAVTAKHGLEERLRALETGANEVIGIPVDLTELRIRTASLLQLKEIHDTARRCWTEIDALVAAGTAAVASARSEALAARRAKSAFLGRMNHEFRTPLTTILGLSELLLEAARDGHAVAEFVEEVEEIRAAGARLLDIATHVLEFTDAQAGQSRMEATRVRVSDLLHDLMQREDIRALAAENRNELQLALSTGVGEIQTDPYKLARILVPLVQNACKFTLAGTVRVEAVWQGGSAFDWLLLTVTDTGIGMTPQQAQLATDPFWKAEEDPASRHFAGAGLGLSVARQFCELLGGYLSIESQPGGGTSVGVHLPAAMSMLTDAAAGIP